MLVFVTAIRVIFDGKAFIPQEPVSLPNQSEATVIIEQDDQAAQAQLENEIRAYYQYMPDADDDAWAAATAPQSHKAWDEDKERSLPRPVAPVRVDTNTL
jgi:hypothetical protein